MDIHNDQKRYYIYWFKGHVLPILFPQKTEDSDFDKKTKKCLFKVAKPEQNLYLPP